MMNKTGRNLKYLRENNTNQILKILTIQNESSRIGLSRQLGLSKMTITNIVSDLLEKEYLIEYKAKTTGLAVSTGPKPLHLSLKPERILAIGVYVSRNRIYCALCDIVGKEIYVEEKQSDTCNVEKDCLEQIYECIDKVLAYNRKLNQYIIGIGVSSMGEVDSEQGILLKSTDRPNVIRIPIRNALKERYDYPIFVSNDMNASALAELIYGHGKKYNDFVKIAITYGVGAAVVSSGKVLKGNRGLGAEISHMSIDYHGEQCDCGNRGCLELYVGIDALLKKTGANNLKELLANIESQQMQTVAVMEEFVNMMCAVLTNIVNVFDPECIIFGHEGVIFAEKYLDQMEAHINSRCILSNGKQVKVMVSAFRDIGGLRGASTLVFNQLFEGYLSL